LRDRCAKIRDGNFTLVDKSERILVVVSMKKINFQFYLFVLYLQACDAVITEHLQGQYLNINVLCIECIYDENVTKK